MELKNTPEQEQNLMSIEKIGVDQLLEMRKWSMFLSILGFVFIGLFTIVILVMFSLNNTLPSGVSVASFIPVLIVMVMVIYFFPIYYLYKFSSTSKNALITKNASSLANAFCYLKKHYKFIGIMSIVILSVYVLAFVFTIMSGLALSSF